MDVARPAGRAPGARLRLSRTLRVPWQHLATQPQFLAYTATVVLLALALIQLVAPRHGKRQARAAPRAVASLR